jgi:hypothetical protein
MAHRNVKEHAVLIYASARSIKDQLVDYAVGVKLEGIQE